MCCQEKPSSVAVEEEATASLLPTAMVPQVRPYRAPQNSPKTKIIVLALLGSSLLVSAFVMLAISVVEHRRLENTRGSYDSPVPEFPVEIVKFGPAVTYSEGRSLESDAAWKALAGPKSSRTPLSRQGFIWVKDWERYGIHRGSPENGSMKYGISMFHQLHCLGALREIFYDMLEDTFDREEFLALDKHVGSPEFVPSHRGLWHAQHCFNYLRQSVQCAGDMALEWPTYFNGTPVVVGWNSPHKCRSWKAMWDYAEKHA